ncbi:MAG: cation transporter [Chitinophagaceae bacterium]|nr:cation transporter [Chitinophagaceae bacterium]
MELKIYLRQTGDILQQAQVNFRLQKIVTLIAVILFIIKIIAWYITQSISILTDALESTVNVIAGFISLYSLYIAAKPRDSNHPYGHGKAEFLSAAVEGSLIFIAGIVIIYQAIYNFFYPHELQKLDYGILLVAVTAIINLITGRYCVSVGKRNNSLALIASGKHLQSDTWSTLGIIIGLIVIWLTTLKWLDGAIAICLAIYIMYTGYTIVRSSIAGIMDEADRELLEKMVQLLNQNRKINWIDLHNLRIIKFGNVLHTDCHLTVPWYLNVREAHEEIETLSSLIRKEFGETVEFFVHADGCCDFSCKICNKQDCTVRKFVFEKRIEWTVDNISRNTRHDIYTEG